MHKRKDAGSLSPGFLCPGFVLPEGMIGAVQEQMASNAAGAASCPGFVLPEGMIGAVQEQMASNAAGAALNISFPATSATAMH
jgi:hypothetical protein